jgi:hypothetical protein
LLADNNKLSEFLFFFFFFFVADETICWIVCAPRLDTYEAFGWTHRQRGGGITNQLAAIISQLHSQTIDLYRM